MTQRRKRIIATVLTVLIVAVFSLGAGLVFGIQSVYLDNKSIYAELEKLSENLEAPDKSQAEDTALRIAKTAQHMKASTDGFPFAVSSLFPVYGGDVATMRELASILDTLSSDALVPFVKSMHARCYSDLIADGKVDASEIQHTLASLEDYAQVLDECNERASKLGEPRNRTIANTVRFLRETLAIFRSTATNEKALKDFIPNMLGYDAQKTYVLVVEDEKTSQMSDVATGNEALMHIDSGAVDIVDMGEHANTADGVVAFNQNAIDRLQRLCNPARPQEGAFGEQADASNILESTLGNLDTVNSVALSHALLSSAKSGDLSIWVKDDTGNKALEDAGLRVDESLSAYAGR